MGITKAQLLAALAMYKYREDEYNDEKFIPQEGGSIPSGNFTSNPIGTIISYMGNTPPKEYLTCDGTVYNIEDYQALADHIKDQFGSYDFFGGNGTTTFAVPDLRGEFLRGTGTNSHTNQGSGSNVGVHQDGTEFQVNAYNASDKTILYKGYNTSWDSTPKYFDSYVSGNNSVAKFVTSSGTNTSESSASKGTSRPTNTSVLYCIKYTNAVAAKQITDWAANTEYNAGDCAVYKDKIYKCISPNSDSTFNLLKWVCLTANGEEELGHITFGYNLQSGYIPLDGSTYNRIDYPDLINWVTENNLWAENATDYGKFGAGNGTTTFTTPNFIGKFIECDDGTNTGDYTSAGLPNITGSSLTAYHAAKDQSYGTSGAITTTKDATTGYPNSGSEWGWSRFSFDASNSNSIYGNSTTVQPESIKLIPQIKYRKPNKSLPVNAVRRTLFEGSVGNATDSGSNLSINLNDSYRNYDKLEFEVVHTHDNDDTQKRYKLYEINCSQITYIINAQSSKNIINMPWGYGSYTSNLDLLYTSTDNTLYISCNKAVCTKVIGIKYINPNSYSTDEKLVGTWIDGKPLYQKTYNVNITIDNTEHIIATIPNNIENVVDISGTFKYTPDANLTGFTPINVYYNGSTYRCFVDTWMGNLRVIGNGWTGTWPANITLKYTKTTD